MPRESRNSGLGRSDHRPASASSCCSSSEFITPASILFTEPISLRASSCDSCTIPPFRPTPPNSLFTSSSLTSMMLLATPPALITAIASSSVIAIQFSGRSFRSSCQPAPVSFTISVTILVTISVTSSTLVTISVSVSVSVMISVTISVTGGLDVVLDIPSLWLVSSCSFKSSLLASLRDSCRMTASRMSFSVSSKLAGFC